jgi:hypothetical protein
MSLTHMALVLIGASLAVFSLLQVAALLMSLRRPAAATGLSTGARLLWTVVPLGMIALLFGSLLISGRISL